MEDLRPVYGFSNDGEIRDKLSYWSALQLAPASQKISKANFTPPVVAPDNTGEYEDDCEVVKVLVDGAEERLLVDPVMGPRVLKVDGTIGYMELKNMSAKETSSNPAPPKQWCQMTGTEQEVFLLTAARKNQKLRAWKGKEFWKKSESVRTVVADLALQRVQEEAAVADEVRARVERRCRMEASKGTFNWMPITIDTVTLNWEKSAPGMFYGLEFPWSEAMLAKMGPTWLTKAFHAAGTLDKDNEVKQIIMEKKIKVTTGNNGGKFLFEVRYAKDAPGLHKQLFAKVPFPLNGVTKTDRLSSSVNKQPQEFYEINTSRLLEGALPVKIPRFYFGDISNETSNWILITERIQFADHQGMNFGRPSDRKRLPLKAHVIEGPYDKCVDYNLRGADKDYYMLLVAQGAKIAGLYKAGALGTPESLRGNFGSPWGDPSIPETWGVNPNASTGEAPGIVAKKLEQAATFLSKTGRVLFKEYVAEDSFQAKLRSVMMTLAAYTSEIAYWKHMNPDYTALTHSNMNVDNAYFWRDAEGKLDCGIFDWGAMSASCVGHKLWWWVYCGDYAPFRRNLKEYIAAFISTYQEYGGPKLDSKELEMMVIITGLEQMMGLVSAVPQILKMCPSSEWPTIRDRYDRRIAENIDGKSSLRLYLHVMNTITRIIEEMKGDQVLEDWIERVYVRRMKQTPKTDEVIFG